MRMLCRATNIVVISIWLKMSCKGANKLDRHSSLCIRVQKNVRQTRFTSWTAYWSNKTFSQNNSYYSAYTTYHNYLKHVLERYLAFHCSKVDSHSFKTCEQLANCSTVSPLKLSTSVDRDLAASLTAVSCCWISCFCSSVTAAVCSMLFERESSNCWILFWAVARDWTAKECSSLSLVNSSNSDLIDLQKLIWQLRINFSSVVILQHYLILALQWK